MNFEIFQIDAFADAAFKGNPAAVVLLENWLEDRVLQNIAAENNLSETAFIIEKKSTWAIRWFTPAREVDLCGHATLASAHVLFFERHIKQEEIHFESRSGRLAARRNGELITLDFPTIASKILDGDTSPSWIAALQPVEVLGSSQDLMVVMRSQRDVENFVVDPVIVSTLNCRGLIITSRGQNADFVSRCFYPELQVDEDPVTGSAHCQLTPYWGAKLGKTKMVARQLSRRGGTIYCEMSRDRILLSGQSFKYLQGTITF
ncbi:MAG: PhzF family phenazine biosynthesis protein [Deltaproteobacteria bacterium]|nr:PhzF family phenazine biosynthesis protein [Deltaproteobacteria bacterium]